MVLALMVSLVTAAPTGAAATGLRSDDPPVKVWLNQDNYFVQGDRARVNVKVAEDGYLVVLRADADGRIRVLFPLDPSDDSFVRGGSKIEVRGRGDREAFYVDDREGTGVVLAARSVQPFKFDAFVRGDHWDYRVLSAREADQDKEQMLLDVVQRMLPDGHFDYDVVSYTVESPNSYSRGYSRHYYTSIGFGYGYGWPYYRSRFAFGSCFDPFFYDPFFCGSTFYDPFYYGSFFSGYGYRYGYAYGYPYIYRLGAFGYGRGRYGGGLFIDRARGPGGGLVFKNRSGSAPTVMGVSPRLRIPHGTLLNRTGEGRGIPVSAPGTTPVRLRDPWMDGSRAPTRARGEPAGRRAPEGRQPDRAARQPERRDNGRGWSRPSSGGGGGGGGGGWSGGSRGGGGGGSSSAGRGSSGSSGGSRGSAPSNGGGRRRP